MRYGNNEDAGDCRAMADADHSAEPGAFCFFCGAGPYPSSEDVDCPECGEQFDGDVGGEDWTGDGRPERIPTP